MKFHWFHVCRWWVMVFLGTPILSAESALEVHAASVRATAPEGFTVLVSSPFIVLGDESADIVRHRSRTTVKWSVDRLKAEFFQRDPVGIIDIWLFRDAESYRRNALALFGDTPTTPYGYYSSAHRALVMNIATGGGTLVHEIVHPFMRANFPACPAWFDEGFASLFEQCGEKDGRIRGLVNWRLPALQREVREGTLPSFRELTSTTSATFYGVGTGASYGRHYAQARYLCFYLQERGLLRKFYHAFVANAAADPTGIDTLMSTLGEKDVVAFQKKWETFVLALQAP